ncbi:MAG: acyl CoA:acetate/3-ketoacid CoA transferase [Sporolactobacillus sp.]
MAAQFLKPEEAVGLIQDGDTVSTSGFVAAGLPETLTTALEKHFLSEGSPKNLTLFHCAGQGNGKGVGSDHFAHEGLIKRVVAGHYNLAPKLNKMIVDNKVEGYNLPQGTIAQLYRDIAAHRVGTITHVGLNTFVDPRNEGGKLNSRTTEDLVKLIQIENEQKLLYKAFPVDVALVRGTYADERGNISLENEVCISDAKLIAQAAKNSGGKVIVQVDKVVAAGALNPKLVEIPGIYVDAVVVASPSDRAQYIDSDYEFDPSLSGQLAAPTGEIGAIPLNQRKIIARRAAMELQPSTVVNLGIGIPEAISMVANEEGMGDYMTLTVEAGPVGGIPLGGDGFGASINADAIFDEGAQFDFYDGGGLDLAYLGLAQVDQAGNVNVSKFGTRIAGCGGFINITQNAKKVFYCGTFTAGGLKIQTGDGKLTIAQEGKFSKFVEQVDQVTFSSYYAQQVKQPVMYITERAVFELREDGLYLTEIAPGIDLEHDVLRLMAFKPKMGQVKTMDERIFRDQPMGLANKQEAIHA